MGVDQVKKEQVINGLAPPSPWAMAGKEGKGRGSYIPANIDILSVYFRTNLRGTLI
jgi:hypothetical protein